MTNKLCLGTVQFGMNYGINNQIGQPLRQAVFEMIDYAKENGVQYLDTAAAYGEAEEILGMYPGGLSDVGLISKLRPNLMATTAISQVKPVLRDQVCRSLKKLGVAKLDGFLLHTPADFYNEAVMEAMQECRDEGIVGHIGVSIYETQHALDVVSSGIVDYIQIPYNVFDQRLDQTEFFSIAKRNKVTVFGRSAFLQGLLLMNDDGLPTHLAQAKGYLQQFDEIIAQYGFSRQEAAFLFSYQHPGIDYVVFGVETMEQLKENIAMSKQAYNFAACRQALSAAFNDVEKTIIFPSLWAKP